ncbi:MAG: ATP-binding protein [Prolixibacteraceae bacterium]|nr:ATP-binding protein [Prolixibacteraceae bacterium]MBN2774374.1 ATP-binding protein [Prolixibacteraceae bacterium]
MRIAIASGKGGTGKTTVAVNLYYFIEKYLGKDVMLVDCDVEEPNDALFFKDAELTLRKQSYRKVPFIDTEKCTFCKKCSDWCEFNAIVISPGIKFAEIYSDLCHSCGACTAACKYNAIAEYDELQGSITTFETGIGKGLLEGRLKIGSAMQTGLIKDLKKEIKNANLHVIYDAPPGTSCPVVETISDADYVILVTEPTPFGLHDLKITVDLLEDMKIPFGLIINKSGLGNNGVYNFSKSRNIELLGEIPFSKDYASSYASGDILKEIPLSVERTYFEIISKLKSIIR